MSVRPFSEQFVLSKPRVIVDPYPRRMDEIFSPEDIERLRRIVHVDWGRDEPMPLEDAEVSFTDAVALVCSSWRYSKALHRAANLRAIIDVGGRFPPGLDYEACFERHIRVLTCAPAFAPQVAEMALGMALAASREIDRKSVV